MGVGGASLKARARRDREPLDMGAVSQEMMLIPRADFEFLGGFDEGYAADAADLDLCRRATEAGGRVLVQPAASGVQFLAARRQSRREAAGLARFMERAARTPGERAMAVVARPALSAILASRRLARAVFGASPR
jgi:GT2 family glycosyltransferase